MFEWAWKTSFVHYVGFDESASTSVRSRLVQQFFRKTPSKVLQNLIYQFTTSLSSFSLHIIRAWNIFKNASDLLNIGLAK